MQHLSIVEICLFYNGPIHVISIFQRPDATATVLPGCDVTGSADSLVIGQPIPQTESS